MIALARAAALFVFLVASVPAAHGWGTEGHRLIAEMAEARLTVHARAEVERLLFLERGASLASVSTWADESRRSGTAPLHYVNLPNDDCTYSRQRDCPDGRCVVEAIAGKLAILKSQASDAERLIALKWVVHLVGDVHQPLHAGLASDKGGNLHQVLAFGRGSNMHAVWDTGLIKQRRGGPRQLLQDALAALTPSLARTDPKVWAAESCEVRRRAGFYPDGRGISAGYAEQWDAELVNRLSLAGARLAHALNEALGR